MGTPQPGIFAIGTPAQHHLEFRVAAGAAGTAAAGSAVRAVREATTTPSGVNVVVGFGPSLTAAVFDGLAPVDLANFETIIGPGGYEIPASQADLWVWLHGPTPGALFDLARLVHAELGDAGTLITDRPTFGYGASQDLTGFEDGTENPPIDEATEVATIVEDGPADGGSIVLVQQWRHDLDAFIDRPLAEREAIVGRTLSGSVELTGDAQPPSSHVSRTAVKDGQGDELKVFRRSTPYGAVADHGLQFLSFSADRARVQLMLDRMAGIGDGVRDRITEFSTPLGGSWYFAPPLELLRAL